MFLNPLADGRLGWAGAETPRPNLPGTIGSDRLDPQTVNEGFVPVWHGQTFCAAPHYLHCYRATFGTASSSAPGYPR